MVIGGSVGAEGGFHVILVKVDHLPRFTAQVFVHGPWTMDVKIFALAAEPLEPKHAKCINANKKEVFLGTTVTTHQQEVLK